MGGLAESKALDGQTMVIFLKKIFKETKVKPKVFHTDQGTAFMSDSVQSYLRSEDITVSADTRHKYGFGNQIMESFNNKLWTTLELSKKNKQEIMDFAAKSAQDRMFIVEAAISFLNKNVRRVGKPYTNAELYEALMNMEEGPDIKTAKGTKEAEIVTGYHEMAVSIHRAKTAIDEMYQYNETTAQELRLLLDKSIPKDSTNLELMEGMMEQVKTLCMFLMQQASITRQAHEQLFNQNEQARSLLEKNFEDLKKQHIETIDRYRDTLQRLDSVLTQLDERSRKELEEKEAKEALRLKHKNRTKQPVRASLSESQISRLLEMVEGSTAFVKARDRVALILMLTFGLRVGNLRAVTKQMLSTLFKGKPTEIKLEKDRGTVNFRLVASETHLAWFKAYGEDFKLILNNPDMLPGESFYKVTREVITRRLNGYFKKLSLEDGIHARSHSLRITLGTKAIDKLGVETAKNLLGHSSIMTTMRYNRNRMTESDQAHAYEVVLPEAPKIKKGPGRPKKVKKVQEMLKKAIKNKVKRPKEKEKAREVIV